LRARRLRSSVFLRAMLNVRDGMREL
jgi:hypothetical protein